MERFIKAFHELTVPELHEIYALRCAVFVVEQNCPYQDIDGFDPRSLHIFFREEGRIIAYLRVLPRGCVFEEVSLGRVISVKRRQGVATELLREGIRAARERFGAESILIEAQTYARRLYEKQGFVAVSEEFLEDGIPHLRLRLTF